MTATAIVGRLAVGLLVAFALLTACAQQEGVGEDPGTWTPLSITTKDNGSTIEMVIGQVALFEDLPMNDGEDLNVIADPAGVVKIERAESNSGAVSTGPALIAEAPGTAKVTVSYDEANQAVMQVTIIVN